MEKYEHIIKYYEQLPSDYQKNTIIHLKELKTLVYDLIDVPELEGEMNIIIRKTLLNFDYILGDELIAHTNANFARLIVLKQGIIDYLTVDYSAEHSYGSILTFSHYMNYILFVVITIEDYMKQTYQ